MMLKKEFGLFSSKYWITKNCFGNYDRNYFEKKAFEATKLYVSLPKDHDKIFYVVTELWYFLRENRIPSSSKFASTLRCDGLVVRVLRKEDVQKIIEFIGNLEYDNEIQPNPFLFHHQKVAIGKDSGKPSYNELLSQIILSYINEYGKDLNNINFDTFKSYVEKASKEQEKENYKVPYKMLVDIINDNVSIDDFVCDEVEEDKSEIMEAILDKLTKKYEVDAVKKMIEYYLIDENLENFPTADNIRKNIMDHFTMKEFEDTFVALVWSKLYQASYKTYEQLGLEEMIVALEKLFVKGVYSHFTNENNERDELANICSHKFLMQVIKSKFRSMNEKCDVKSFITYIVKDIESNYGNVAKK